MPDLACPIVKLTQSNSVNRDALGLISSLTIKGELRDLEHSIFRRSFGGLMSPPGEWLMSFGFQASAHAL